MKHFASTPRRACVLVVALAAGYASATNDTSLSAGSSRMAGMAGAGLALPFDVAINGQINPALFARSKRKFDFETSDGYYLGGVTYSALKNDLTNVSGGGTSASDALQIAETLGNTPIEFGAHADFALALQRFVVSFSGGADVTSDPNASLEAWSNSGGNTTPNNIQDDIYGYGYQSLNFGYGQPFETKMGQFAFGAQLRFIKSYYSHYFVNAVTQNNGLAADTSGTLDGYTWNSSPASEMGGANDLTSTGTGLDLGFLYSTPDDKNHFGISALNFVEPKVGFNETLPGQLNQGTNATLASQDLNPFRRTVNVGWGGEVAPHLSLAADEVDLGNDAGQESFRAGADYSFGHGFGIRGGYDARDRFAVGVSILGINLAYSGKDPLTLSYMLKY